MASKWLQTGQKQYKTRQEVTTTSNGETGQLPDGHDHTRDQEVGRFGETSNMLIFFLSTVASQ